MIMSPKCLQLSSPSVCNVSKDALLFSCPISPVTARMFNSTTKTQLYLLFSIIDFEVFRYDPYVCFCWFKPAFDPHFQEIIATDMADVYTPANNRDY